MIELSNSRTELKLPSRRYTVMSRKKRSTLFIHELDCGLTGQSDWMVAYGPGCRWRQAVIGRFC